MINSGLKPVPILGPSEIHLHTPSLFEKQLLKNRNPVGAIKMQMSSTEVQAILREYELHYGACNSGGATHGLLMSRPSFVIYTSRAPLSSTPSTSSGREREREREREKKMRISVSSEVSRLVQTQVPWCTVCCCLRLFRLKPLSLKSPALCWDISIRALAMVMPVGRKKRREKRKEVSFKEEDSEVRQVRHSILIGEHRHLPNKPRCLLISRQFKLILQSSAQSSGRYYHEKF